MPSYSVLKIEAHAVLSPACQGLPQMLKLKKDREIFHKINVTVLLQLRLIDLKVKKNTGLHVQVAVFFLPDYEVS